jgi:hypothetical protein
MHLAGCNVSNWLLSEEALDVEGLDYEFGKRVAKRFKAGHGSRNRSKCRGGSAFFGTRRNSRSLQTPGVGPGATGSQQYFREPWGRDGNEYERLILQEKVRRLPLLNSIVRTASNYSLFVGLRLADKVILTYGRPGSFFSFFNEDHEDNDDFIFPADEWEWLQELELDSCNEHTSMISSRLQETIELLGGICLPTTCSYRHLWDTLDGKVPGAHVATQFFDYCSLGVMQAVLDGTVHFMLPSAFSHRTSMCLLEHEGRVHFMNDDSVPGFNLLAWGNAAGGADAQRNRATRHRNQRHQGRQTDRARLRRTRQTRREERRGWVANERVLADRTDIARGAARPYDRGQSVVRDIVEPNQEGWL